MSDRGEAERLLRRLSSRRGLARLAILFELVWPAVWPPLGLIGLFVCAALLGLPQRLPALWHAGLLLALGGAVLVLLVRGLLGVRAPDDAAADRRLERASGLRHRPLSVLTDRPARPDAAAEPLWQAHVARAMSQLRRLRVGLPRPGLARLDRRALRGGLVVGLVATVVIAGEDAPSRIAAALQPTLPPAPVPPATQLQAWITPPGYTRLAPVFLKPEGGAVSVPAGSHLTVNVTGGEGEPVLALNGHIDAFRALDRTSFQADRDLAAGGRLVVRRRGSELAAWDLSVVADEPPTVAWTEPPGPARNSQEIRLPWEAHDDYGVVGVEAELRLDQRRDAPPVVLAIPIPGNNPKSAHGNPVQDLTSHPWAGLPVVARLKARDAAGQTGESEDATFTLPERPFQNPLARAVIAVRKELSLHPERREQARDDLSALLQAPDAFGDDAGAYINTAAIAALLGDRDSAKVVGEAQDRLWELALHLEEWQTERTARALDAARKDARQALDRAAQDPNRKEAEQVDRKLKELEQAIQRHMQALADQARREPSEIPPDADVRQLDSRELQRMVEAARDAARQNKMEEARQRMAELERMLDQLRGARVGNNRNNAQKQAEGRQRGRQQMGALQDMIGRQGGLLDHAQGRSGQNADPDSHLNRNLEPQQSDQQQADQKAQREADRKVQQALRRALGELMQQFGDLTGQVPKSLGEADTAMRDAGHSLAEGKDGAAGDAEQRAIEALQKGGREMGQQMAKQFGRGQQPNQGDEGENGDPSASNGFTLQDGHSDQDGQTEGNIQGNRGHPERRDPFGRQLGEGSSGADESADVQVPEQMERQRARSIQDELRRRGAERERPQEELDYIDRLLKQF